MKRALRIAAGAGLVTLAAMILAGCKGTGSCPDEQGMGRAIKVYEIHFHPESKSIAMIGNGGAQAPMYQADETAGDPGPGGAPNMPASGNGNAVTAHGKVVMVGVNDAYQRTAETDLATAATLASGLQQSQVGQTAPQTLREGTTTGTQTQTSSPQQNDTTQLNPVTALTGEGMATVPGQANTQAGQGAQATATPTTTSTPTLLPPAPFPGSGTPAETEQAAAAALSNGVATVTTTSGKRYVGRVVGTFARADGFTDVVLDLGTAGAVKVAATAEQVAILTGETDATK